MDDTPAPMTERMRAFVREYTKDHRGKDAAIRAGYGEKSAKFQASKLLARADIREAVAAREAAMADELGMTHEWILAKLRDVIEVATTPVPKIHQGKAVQVVVDGLEQLVTEIDAAAATRALEAVMKHRGMLDERPQIKIDATVEYTLTLDGELADTEETP